MPDWRKHPKSGGQRALNLLAAAGWTILDTPKYYKALCPCGEHKRWVHLSPSNPRYWNELIGWARRLPCWQDGGR
jgi:hypothetical protein